MSKFNFRGKRFIPYQNETGNNWSWGVMDTQNENRKVLLNVGNFFKCKDVVTDMNTEVENNSALIQYLDAILKNNHKVVWFGYVSMDRNGKAPENIWVGDHSYVQQYLMTDMVNFLRKNHCYKDFSEFTYDEMVDYWLRFHDNEFPVILTKGRV